MNCKILKLNNGEEIIANVEETENTIIIDQPMVFSTSTMTDQIGRPIDVTFLKDWLNHSDNKKIELEKSKIVMMTDASKKSVEFYDLEKAKNSLTEEPVIEGDGKPLEQLLAEMDKLMGEMTDAEMNDLSDQERNYNEYSEMEEEEYRRKKKRRKKRRNTNPNSMIPEELQNRPMIYMNMIIPPEAIMNLISSGVIDPDMIQAMIDQVKKKNKFTGDEKTRQDFGNKFSDWNPDPSSDDYK